MQIAKRMRLEGNLSRREDDTDLDDEEQRTLFCTNISENVTEELLYELFIQSGPIESVRIPKDKDGRQRGFGFVTFAHASSVSYALHLYTGTRLYKRELIIKPRNSNNSRNRSFDADRSTNNDISRERDNNSPARRHRNDDEGCSSNSGRRFQNMSDAGSSLRGSSNRQNRIDMNMQPRAIFTSPMNNSSDNMQQMDNNRFKLNDLQQFGANFLMNPFKTANSFDIELNQALSVGGGGNHGNNRNNEFGGGNRGGDDGSQSKYNSRSNRPHQQNSPYYNNNNNKRSGGSDQNRGRGGDWNRSSNRRENRRR